MSLEVTKREGETSQSLIRRFTQKIQKSGVLCWARKRRFFIRPKSQQMKKRAALRRIEITKEYEAARKLGVDK